MRKPSSDGDRQRYQRGYSGDSISIIFILNVIELYGRLAGLL
jgi:hypothetical protein